MDGSLGQVINYVHRQVLVQSGQFCLPQDFRAGQTGMPIDMCYIANQPEYISLQGRSNRFGAALQYFRAGFNIQVQVWTTKSQVWTTKARCKARCRLQKPGADYNKKKLKTINLFSVKKTLFARSFLFRKLMHLAPGFPGRQIGRPIIAPGFKIQLLAVSFLQSSYLPHFQPVWLDIWHRAREQLLLQATDPHPRKTPRSKSGFHPAYKDFRAGPTRFELRKVNGKLTRCEGT